ncbi:hypothetical protein M231_07700 [Tremella mesenterica]|uniref:Uncharacterized protein n=1 Tax=Tremella mesenterica TaxID=5217 RepID=A0A4Q1BAL2_TREME|nr:hypothetical protein M231_07700 [Tremella mesenterica]
MSQSTTNSDTSHHGAPKADSTNSASAQTILSEPKAADPSTGHTTEAGTNTGYKEGGPSNGSGNSTATATSLNNPTTSGDPKKNRPQLSLVIPTASSAAGRSLGSEYED